jgi:hypothetical protein
MHVIVLLHSGHLEVKFGACTVLDNLADNLQLV